MPINYLVKRPRAALDTECMPNFWAIGFRDVETKRVVKISFGDGEELDRARIAKIMRNFRVYTFNGQNYDLPMITLAMSGATCADLKSANDNIILGGLKYWEFYDQYGVTLPDFLDHVDLMEVAPSAAQRASLKKYAGMMHSRTMMEFEHDFDKALTEQEKRDCLVYLDNDLEVTCDLIEELTPQIELRSVISDQYKIDVRSKSDAQVGEAVMRAQVEKRMGGRRIYKPDIVPGVFKYEAPAYISYETQAMRDTLSRLLRANFVIKRDGYVELPEMFGKKKKKEVDDVDDAEQLAGGSEIVIGGNVYKMGIGGLHSQEKKVSHHECDEFALIDSDVVSYYPYLIIASGKEPDNMRGHFRAVYQGEVEARVAAKNAGRKSEAESRKIVVNGLFGKTGSPYSIVYAPRMMIQTTVTGQLSILMLIEQCEERGWEVVSANTDGFVCRVPRNEIGMFRSVKWDWEYASGLLTEETHYKSIHSRDVNNYVALKKKQDKQGNFTGEVEAKRKGVFSPSGRGIPAAMGLKKTPDVEICYDAAVAYMIDGTLPERTIRNCQDIRKFVTVRRVTGGACLSNDEPIGKVVRFYYGVSSTEPLRYIKNGNKVPNSEGAEPCMTLPDDLPGDIDFEWYEREAYAVLHDCGMDVIDPTLVGRTGTYFGRLEAQKTLHTINAATGVAVCGAERKTRRDTWLEYASLPPDSRYCTKCRKIEEL